MCTLIAIPYFYKSFYEFWSSFNVIVNFTIRVFEEQPYRRAALEKRVGDKVRKDSRREGAENEHESERVETTGRDGGSKRVRESASGRGTEMINASKSPPFASPTFLFPLFLFLSPSFSIYLSIPTAATPIRARSRNFRLVSGRTRPSVHVMCHEHSATEIFRSYLSSRQKEINTRAGCRIFILPRGLKSTTLCIILFI